MKPTPIGRTLATSGVESAAEFSLSVEDAAGIMGILRSRLYTDKVLAVIREYSGNAWDVHREGGIDKPVKVVLPTEMAPTFSVRDYGVGLSTEDVLNLYTAYGRSTKRGSNVAVGMMGIGCKSGFAYSDTFTVTSWFQGTKSMYIAVLDERDVGVMNLMHEEPCGDEEGLEVSIPVRLEDIATFKDRATQFYPYFYPAPEINVEIVSYRDSLSPQTEIMESGVVNYDANSRFHHRTGYYNQAGRWRNIGQWTCVMGCIPYKMNPANFIDKIDPDHALAPMLALGGVLFCEIGDMEVAASREELEYSDATIIGIRKALKSLHRQTIEWGLKKVESAATDNWSRRVLLNELIGPILSVDNRAKVKSKFSELMGGVAITAANLFDEDYKGFTVKGDTLIVSSGTKLYFRDVSWQESAKKAVPDNALIISPTGKGVNADKDALKALTKYLATKKFDGIPVQNISELDAFTGYRRQSYRTPPTDEQKKKYSSSTRMFKYAWATHPQMNSERWEALSHVPSDDDVFVLIERFEIAGGWRSGLDYSTLRSDKALCEFLGIDMPEVYAYKITAKKPVKEEDCKGTHYREWSSKLRKLALKDPRVPEAKLYEQRKSHKSSLNWTRRTEQNLLDTPLVMAKLAEVLGKKHPAYALADSVINLGKPPVDSLPDTLQYLDWDSVLKECEESPVYMLSALYEKYPLLTSFGIEFLRCPELLEYIRLKDQESATKTS